MRYIFNFTFWGEFNEPMTDQLGCEDEHYSADCSSAVRLFGIERDGDVNLPPASANVITRPVFFLSLVPDLLLLLFLCIHRATLERLGLWKCV